MILRLNLIYDMVTCLIVIYDSRDRGIWEMGVRPILYQEIQKRGISAGVPGHAARVALPCVDLCRWC